MNWDAKKTTTFFAAAGAALVLITNLFGTGWGVVPFTLWALAPYAVYYFAARERCDEPWIPAGAGAAALAVEAGIRASVFLWPRGSTAAVTLVFSPGYILTVVMPVGALAGWAAGRAWRAGGTLPRAFIALASSAALALAFIEFGRPELFPTRRLKRNRILAEVGEPRVVSGADAFERVPVSASSSWRQAAELDGAPGDEIALVDQRGYELLDPATFASQGKTPFNGDPGRMWNWFSALARLDGRVVVVQTGGGFSETAVRELDGTTLWTRKPDPRLAPDALKPADLDGDGRLEFYTSSNGTIARLDGSGKEVWTKSTRNGSLSATAPRTGGTPAWVVAHEYGRRALVWDENGAPLAEIPLGARVAPRAIVDWPATRGIALLGEGLTILGLDGKPSFTRALTHLSLTDAVSFRPAPGAKPLLAATFAAPPNVKRWALLILDAEGRELYREIQDRPTALFKARRPDGGETLLVSGETLTALRPR